MPQRLQLRDRVFLPHGYDPEIHQPVIANGPESAASSCDVSFIGTYTARKERILSELLEQLPDLSLRIFGNDWNRCSSPVLRRVTHGAAVRGQSYTKAVCSSRINLAIMGVSDHALDETTVRTFEIPACGAFMLHERTEEVLELYDEDREIACFDSAAELAEKIEYYLNNPSAAARVAAAGHRRAVPRYSYDGRMKEIIAYHEKVVGSNACVSIAC
jgi:spore maturation protein CgeB